MDAPPAVEEIFDDANGDLALGDLAAAATKYARCTELAPDFSDGWHALGMALMKLGRYPEARTAALALAVRRSTCCAHDGGLVAPSAGVHSRCSQRGLVASSGAQRGRTGRRLG